MTASRRLVLSTLFLSIAAIALSTAALVVTFRAPTENSASQSEGRDEAAIQALVRDYILENPEILPQAINILRQREQQSRQARLEESANRYWQQVKQDEFSPVVGAADAPVTVVEYYDYRCPYCRRAHSDMTRLLDEHGDRVRYVFKQFPVLDRGDEDGVSHFASRAAIAADRQGKFLDFHNALMTVEGRLNPKTVLAAAEKTGLDLEQLEKDMQDASIGRYFSQTIALAHEIGIDGTPTYIINGKVLAGAHGYDAILELVNAES